ncbi:MAG: pyridoxal-phosphate dependent enzyme, partial [Dehalococcoidia bacterium]|nr:pyridoxal-phosphate dependent enzyme [Dehalococcoidia bacterium]
PDAFLPQQFLNPANPEIHYRTTGPEILNALDRIDAFVAGVGTGGTLTGVGRLLRERGLATTIVAVEPARSPVLQGGRFRPHAIQGIGASFVPGILDQSLIDRVIGVHDDDALAMASRLAREEGLLAGVSAGANVVAACAVAEQLPPDAVVVTILCDTGERYLSLPFSDDERPRPDPDHTREPTAHRRRAR